jgi:hypothetical protein
MAMTTETKNLVHLYKGYQIERFLVREAYAKSGNAHNPTKEWSYAVKLNGACQYITRTLRDAKGFINDLAELPP